jgi:hypothetical protein
MIDFQYNKESREIRVEIKKTGIDLDYLWNSPLRFIIKSSVSRKPVWESEIFPGSWCSYPFAENCKVEIVDSTGKSIFYWEWDPISNGDFSNSFFLLWASRNKGAKGIAIGTHDGTSGEWVVPTREGLIESFLVEASFTQYLELVENYRGITNCWPILSLVTPNGGETEFFESGKGFTNTVLPEISLIYHGGISTKKILPSRSINELIEELKLEKDLKWLHLDVEGIDADLIMGLDEQRVTLPEIIIYENLNLDEIKKSEISKWMEDKNYSYVDSGWNTVAIKI